MKKIQALLFIIFLLFSSVHAQKRTFFQASFGPLLAGQDYEKAHRSAPGTEQIGSANFGGRTSVALMFRDTGALNGWSFGINRFALRTHEKIHVLMIVDYEYPFVPVVRSAYTGIFGSYTFKRKFRDKLLISPSLSLGLANHRYTQLANGGPYDSLGSGFQHGYESKRNIYTGLGVNFERRYCRKNEANSPGHLSLVFGFFYGRTILAQSWKIGGYEVPYFAKGYRNFFSFDVSLKVEFEWIKGR